MIHPDAPVMQDANRRYHLDRDADAGPTCKGPGPTRHEFVNEADNRDVRTVTPCPRCDGRGSHYGYTLVTLEQQELAS